MTPTPGFRTRIAVYFTLTNGRRRAYRWSPSQLRSFPMSLVTAEQLVAQELVDVIDGNPLKPAAVGADTNA